MKRNHSLLSFLLGIVVFFIVILSGGMKDRCYAVQGVGGQNYFQIWYYGIDNNSAEVEMLVNTLYLEALVFGISVDNLSLINKGPSIINDLNDSTNTYGFDNISPTTIGNGMSGFFNNPGNSYILNQDPDTGITTYLFGLVWVDDGDGVSPETEDNVPNLTGSGAGDGNGDGTPDREQSNVTSLQGAGSAYVTISNTDNLTQTNVQATDPPSDAPSNVTFPYGMFKFDISGLQNGGTAHMKIYVPQNDAINGYWKKNINTGEWENIATSITTEGNKTVITFDLTDGGPYDEDGSENGAISDQGGPGVGGGAVAIGPMPAQPVPTISEWGAIILTFLMGIVAIFAFKRKGYDL